MEIRGASEDDRPGIVGIYNHYVRETAITFDLAPFTPETRAPWFEQFDRSPRHRLLVAVDETGVRGYACSTALRPKAAYDRSVETTIYLAPDATGTGLGRRLYGALLETLAGTDVHRCFAVITQPNPESMRLHAGLGFIEVGRLGECGRKFDRWWDVVWMQKGL